MKICSYCGQEYPDYLTECPLDGKPVVTPKALHSTMEPPPAPAPNVFRVKLVSPLLSAGTYQVFVERSDLLFIQLEGGTKSVVAALAPLLGPLGGLVPLALWLFTKRKVKQRRENLSGRNPEDLLHDNESHFKLNTAEIRDAAIEPPSAFATSSGKAGRLNLVVRHGEKIRCEFDNADEVSRAISLLAPLLHSTLRICVEWSGGPGRPPFCLCFVAGWI